MAWAGDLFNDLASSYTLDTPLRPGQQKRQSLTGQLLLAVSFLMNASTLVRLVPNLERAREMMRCSPGDHVHKDEELEE